MPTARINLEELKSFLWESANILRGSIDSSDFKTYIFALLFYKRLCDVWEEEFLSVRALYGEEQALDPDEHRYQIAEGYFWKDIRKVSKNIGEALNKAFNKIEDLNPKLYGIFGAIDFADTNRFSDATIEKLLAHFDKKRLRNEDVEADILGNAYEYLIAQFADDAGKKGGEFFTPKEVVRLIIDLIDPTENNSVYDPACGSGGMLLECYKHLKSKDKNPRNLTMYGQEKNLNTWSICKINMFLHDIESAFIERGDTLIEPKHLVDTGEGTKGALRTFDRVVANPPFSLKNWGAEVWNSGDPFGRDKFGVPPKSYGDLAFVQHMIASLNSTGKMGVVLPHGILFRGGAEGKIRQGILEEDLIEAVVGLPTNLFFGTGIPACILVVNKDKSDDRKDKVLFIDGSNDYKEGKNQNSLRDEDIVKIEKAFKGFEDIEKYCRVVELAEIKSNDYNLNIKRYVDTSEEEEKIDVAEKVKELRQLEKEYALIEEQFNGYLKELGYEG
jgi:type I restriction enzyme M protein